MQHNRQVTDDASSRQTEPPEAQLPDGAQPAAGLPVARGISEGYAALEVDEFLAELRRSVRRDPPTMAPYEVADQRFKVSRFGRRYTLRDVDELLDQSLEVLRERHGEDAVANLEGTAPEPRHVRTWWIYVVALVLVAVMVAFILTQL